LLGELLSESSSGSLGRASSEPLSEVSGGALGKLPGAGLGPGFAGLLAGVSARWSGEFFRRLLPESFGPELGGGFPEAFDERFSEELESLWRKVVWARRNGVHGADMAVYARGLADAYATKQGLRRDVLRKIARGVFDIDI
jgi:hypothetical protein